ncbi:MAG: branched-chain-amino-acid transaminase [Proteobacteria bacterium]|nr:branched-chain-amino-acid transaminase [Pseudomonadota bacterium]
MKIYIDGEYFDKDEARISVYDHGLLYGDGVFEGIRLYNGRVFKLEAHLERLWNSAKAILLAIPLSLEQMSEAVLKTIEKSGLKDGYIRLIVTRGKGDLGINPMTCPKPTVIIIVDKISLYPEENYQKGIKIITASTRRISADALDPKIKSLNYLNNVLAKLEAIHAGCLEAIMLNHEGHVAECTGDNIFHIKNGILYTPDPSCGALQGITRQAVLEAAEKIGMKSKVTRITPYDLYTADECFLTGTAAEIMPVVSIDGRSIGNGQPGGITTDIQEAFLKLIG